MALKAVVKTLEEVDEKFRDLYVKNEDGTFRLDAEGVEDVGALKTALQKEREANKKKLEKKENEGGLSEAEKKELQDLRKEREDREVRELEEQKKFDSLRQRLETKHATEMTASQQKEKAASERLFRTLKENAATAAIAKSKGKVGPLIPHVISHLDVIDEDGELKVVVKGSDGSPRYSKDSPKDVMSVDELVKTDFLNNEDFMPLFEGTGSSGSGSSGGTKGRSAGGAFTISRADAKDASKYQAAKEVATKAGGVLQIVE